MNNIMLTGRLTRDAEIKYTLNKGVMVANFSIAVDRIKKDSQGNSIVDFIPVQVFGKSAEFVNSYVCKGDLVGVSGSLNIDRYENSSGESRLFARVSATRIELLRKAGDSKLATQEEAMFVAESSEDVPF